MVIQPNFLNENFVETRWWNGRLLWVMLQQNFLEHFQAFDI